MIGGHEARPYRTAAGTFGWRSRVSSQDSDKLSSVELQRLTTMLPTTRRLAAGRRLATSAPLSSLLTSQPRHALTKLATGSAGLSRRSGFVARALSSNAKSNAQATDLHKPPSSVDQFATSNNAYYAEEMFRLWKKVSQSVGGTKAGKSPAEAAAGRSCNRARTEQVSGLYMDLPRQS